MTVMGLGEVNVKHSMVKATCYMPRARTCIAFGSDRLTIRTTDNETIVTVTRQLNQVLGACHGIGPLSLLADRAARRLGIGENERSWLITSIDYLVSVGLIVPVDSLPRPWPEARIERKRIASVVRHLLFLTAAPLSRRDRQSGSNEVRSEEMGAMFSCTPCGFN